MPRKKLEIPNFQLKRYKDRPGIYIAWTSNRCAQRVPTGTEDEEEARRKLDQFIAGWHTPDTSSGFTVAQATKEYLRHKRRVYMQSNAPARLYKNLEYSDRVIQPFFGHVLAEEIKRIKVREFTDALHKAKQSRATIRKHLEHLSAALHHAKNEGLISKVPKIDKPAPPPPREVILRREEAIKFINGINTPHVKLFALLALYTLSRKTAILELTWDRVDMDNRRIEFNVPGRERTRKRRVPVTFYSSILYNALEDTLKLAQTDYVVEYNGQHVQDIKKAFRAAARKLRMGHVTPHVLRHTGASLMAMNGVSMEEIAAYMGDSIATVERHYLKYHPEYLKNAANALKDIYG